MDLISIIVPVYKVEKYLDRCVESLVNQTYRNLEIILVDDGSPDTCGALCDRWARMDNRIKVVHKENEGPGCARNTGLEYATGDYVLFVDSDDYICLELCEKTLRKLLETQAEICYFGMIKEKKGKLTPDDMSAIKSEYLGDAIIQDFLANAIAQDEFVGKKPPIGMSAGKVLYRKELLNKYNIHFPAESLNEDLLFRIALCKHLKKVVVIHEGLYYYAFNGESLSHRYQKGRFETSLKLYDMLCEMTEEFHSEEIEKRCIRSFMNNIVVCLKQEAVYEAENGRAMMKQNIERICDNQTVQQLLSRYPVHKMPLSQRVLFQGIVHHRTAFLIMLLRVKTRQERRKES